MNFNTFDDENRCQESITQHGFKCLWAEGWERTDTSKRGAGDGCLHINSAWAWERACAGLNLRGTPSWKVDVVKDRRRTNKRPKKTARREPRTAGRTENKKRQVKREKTSGAKTFYEPEFCLITSREFVRQFRWTEGKWSWWAAYSAVATSSTAVFLLVNIRLEWNLVNEQ